MKTYPPGMDVVRERLRDLFAEDDRILAVYVHGSYGTDAFRADSDLDCALLLTPGRELPASERLKWSGVLGGRLGMEVDLGCLSTRNLVYAAQVIEKGRRVFCRDPALADAWVGRALSLYADFRKDRRPVEEAYHAA